MNRTIIHCDMNSFFANVELLDHPELAGKAVAVAGSPKDRHGIILAKNEEAKKYGVKTAETIWQARRKCPGLVLLPSHRDKYEKYYHIINAIYLRYTDMVEPFSIDESWLDVSASLKHFGKNGREIADEIRQVVKAETGLTLSAGVSYNKVFAKMGSDYKKPDATTVISEENYRELLWPMAASELFTVGKATAAKLASMNIRTIGDIARADVMLLSAAMGKHGEEIHKYAGGGDDSPVRPFGKVRELKSVGNGITFRRDLKGREDVRTALTALSDKVAGRLRKHGVRAGAVKVDIKDPQFRSISRQVKLSRPVSSSAEICAAALEIVDKNWRYQEPIRLLTVTGINIVPDSGAWEQLSLFSLSEKVDRGKNEAVDAAVDSIRGKFGRYAIMPAGVLRNDLGISYRQEEEEEIEYEEN